MARYPRTQTGAQPSKIMKTAKKIAKKAANKESAKKIGRPSTYSQGIANLICELIADGSSLRSICADERMPSVVTVRSWFRANQEFLSQYARARMEQADHYADEVVTIADTSLDANLARVKIDARKWAASKLNPKRYGDKLDITTRDETPPVTREVMIERMRRSPSFLAEIKSMVTEAEQPAQ